MNIGIIVICTNAYFILGIRFVKKFMHHYKGSENISFYLFTDKDPSLYLPNYTNVKVFHTSHNNWVDGTNSKFSNILKLSDMMCDYLYYFDADTNVTRDFTEEWFIGDIVGGEHYNNRYLDRTGKPCVKPYDRNPKSSAYVPHDTHLPQTYYYGAFFGGKKQQVIDFCEIMIKYQQADSVIHHEPIWNDESYLNKHFHFNPPSRIVPSDKFMFDVSDKGGINNTRNTKSNIHTQLKSISSLQRKPITINC